MMQLVRHVPSAMARCRKVACPASVLQSGRVAHWTSTPSRKKITAMPTTNVFGDGRWSRLWLPAIALYFVFSLPLLAQTSDTQSAGQDQSWTAVTELGSNNANPTRSTESHTQSGNRTLDTRSLQRRGSSGDFEPYQDIETETVKVNSSTVRTVTRTFGRDADGRKTLVQVREEEKRTTTGGDSSVTRVVSNPDANGRLQAVQRDVTQTKKISRDVEETKTTVMLPGINGDLAPAMQVQERREQGANETVKSQKTTLLPDASGNWQVNETQHSLTRKDGKNSTTEERISRLDPDGKLNEVSRTVTKESETAPGENSGTVETYSVDVPGSARDGSMHLVERSATAKRTSSTGQQTVERQVEQPDPGNPDAGLRVTLRTTDTRRPGSSAARSTQTIQALDPNGNLAVVSVDTKKSDNTGTVQVQIAPAEKKK
jgi:hypothetical protein